MIPTGKARRYMKKLRIWPYWSFLCAICAGLVICHARAG